MRCTQTLVCLLSLRFMVEYFLFLSRLPQLSFVNTAPAQVCICSFKKKPEGSVVPLNESSGTREAVAYSLLLFASSFKNPFTDYNTICSARLALLFDEHLTHLWAKNKASETKWTITRLVCVLKSRTAWNQPILLSYLWLSPPFHPFVPPPTPSSRENIDFSWQGHAPLHLYIISPCLPQSISPDLLFSNQENESNVIALHPVSLPRHCGEVVSPCEGDYNEIIYRARDGEILRSCSCGAELAYTFFLVVDVSERWAAGSQWLLSFEVGESITFGLILLVLGSSRGY